MALTTSPESPIPVRQVVTAIGGWVDRLGAVWVEGQVVQLNRPANSNTDFLTLRDKLADVSIQLTCPRAVVDSLPTPLVNGAQVIAHGKPTVYPNRGSLSLSVRELRLVGEGELLARLERRRQLLAAEGLFALELKRPLPFLPHRIGLVTAKDSAAEKDVLENARRRWPGVAFEVRYAAMQGVNAAEQVIAALEALDRDPSVEVIVIARGGGSIEDLLPFSDEALIRAVHRATTPVVSAIGHEPDSPILDLVADLRASTPTDAAKRIVPDVAEEGHRVLQLRDRIRRTTHALVAREQQQLDNLRSRPSMADPRSDLVGRADEVRALRARGQRVLGHVLDRAADDLDHSLARVRALSPLATLRRGYAVLSDADGALFSSVEDIAGGAPVTIRVADGRISATVTGVESIPLPTTSEESDD
ncbi:exodeoxyribonuclease VII large subunit [Nocardioides marmoriginsengisoli]|uniref:Exodeoxyribonuclease 7 large subunit n=1 Tax=Nocardioides marmoriginsengisoli TaxID=661483 RepID=A0A3N0CDM8_9ACTN|nr:exodeoxyribonuclease VII large subunit [Nocardioides marmoriginsengisoli]RNL61341.1 exodeoxyribonuclease VII large subunit [Nocardioides marmoriginsengisoli]